MKYSTAILSTALCISEVAAFPAAAIEYAARAAKDARAAAELDGTIAAYEASRAKRAVGFNAAKQYVSNQGEHAFVAPNLNVDARGPCPGLNAMANHGYLPHNGVANIQQFIDQTYAVFGMGNDLGGFLAVYGALIDGNLESWSIGGPNPALGPTLGLLGTPQGISGSHNKYESDVSPVKPDLYQYGNDYKFVLSQFEQLFATQPDPATANYDIPTLTKFRAARFQQSIDNNPHFFNGPFSGILVQPAAYTFIYRFMSNKSAEFPEGILNQDVLKSFYSVTGEPGSFVWTEGHEKIPDNWYKRAIGDEYTIPYFLSEVVEAAIQYPQFLDVGGNTGTTNSFTGVDLQDLTGGVFNGATLLEGDNLACFVFQSLQQATPDLLKGLVIDVVGAVQKLDDAITKAKGGITCPELRSYDTSQFDKYPGATNVA